MRIVLLCVFAFVLCQSCSKSNTTPTPVTPPKPDTPNLPLSLYNPKPLDTLNDWVRIGRVATVLEDIWFTSNSNGFMISDNCLLKTTDNGITWTQIPNTNNHFVFNIQFVDDQNGFVQGSQLGITQDGGNTWVYKTLSDNSILYFQFVSATTGFYADLTQGIKKTTDAGAHWTSVQTSAQRNFPFYFLDSLRGFSMGGGDFSLSTNGGTNWALKTAHVTTYDNRFYKMQFLDTLTGYCATPNGLLKTINGGINWTNCLADSTTFMIPYFIDSNNGYCLDKNTIYKTTNGGQSWTVSCKLLTDTFSGFHFLDMNTGWASTFGGYFLRLK
jgi:photosystem II stability/assembly factor-like uncharacterized protein